MTNDLKPKWQTIAQAYTHVCDAVEGSTPPPNGMPGTPSNPRKAPCNEHALSVKLTIETTAHNWAAPYGSPATTTEALNLVTLMADQIANDDDLAFLNYQTETNAIYQEAKQFLPAYITIHNAINKDLDHVYAKTIQELSQWLKLVQLPTPEGTLHRWAHEGHIAKTFHGYHLATAIRRKEHTNARHQ